MWCRMLRWLASFLFMGALALPVCAQVPGPGQDKAQERAPPALPYTLALGATLLVLVIVCMPSRKR